MRNRMRSMAHKAKQWRLYERGISSIAIFILGFPLIILSFGFGIDLIRVAQAKRVAQGRLDVAVQAAASMTYTTANGSVRLGVPGDGGTGATALQTARDLYQVNTAPYRSVGQSNGNLFSCPTPVSGAPNLNVSTSSCAGRGGPTIVLPPPPPPPYPCDPNVRTDCDWLDSDGLPRPNYNFCTPASRGGYGVRYDVVEQVPTIFMRMVPGAPRFFNVRVYSQALLRQQYC